MPKIRRSASHAGTWYEGNAVLLSEQIKQWLDQAKASAPSPPRAIIGPHAGYSYCGHVMAYAYKSIAVSEVSRVFLLGPSHHKYTKKCLLSPAATYETPLGPIDIDEATYAELQATGMFEIASAGTDEAEHSLELHIPFIKYLFGDKPFVLVPIIVGALTEESENAYAQKLAKYLDDPSTLFIISSDFCHWGSRFSYQFYDDSQGPIWKSIQWLDELGMKLIESGDAKAFHEYLVDYKNTICGRHPIGVFLSMLPYCSTKFNISFNNYDQSSKCENPKDSSVSYAAAVATVLG